MCRGHHAIPSRDGAAVDTGDAQELDRPDGSHDVEDRVHGPDLVQMHALDGRAVDGGFLFRDEREGGIRAPLYRFRSVGARDDLANLFEMTAVRLGRDLEIHFRARDPRALHLPDIDLYSVEPQALGQRAQPVGLEADRHEGAQRHVARDAAKGVQDRYRHLIRDTRTRLRY